jgi:hypothetical protein
MEQEEKFGVSSQSLGNQQAEQTIRADKLWAERASLVR